MFGAPPSILEKREGVKGGRLITITKILMGT
jgi:hypothetical protein